MYAIAPAQWPFKVIACAPFVLRGRNEILRLRAYAGRAQDDQVIIITQLRTILLLIWLRTYLSCVRLRTAPAASNFIDY